MKTLLIVVALALFVSTETRRIQSGLDGTDDYRPPGSVDTDDYDALGLDKYGEPINFSITMTWINPKAGTETETEPQIQTEQPEVWERSKSRKSAKSHARAYNDDPTEDGNDDWEDDENPLEKYGEPMTFSVTLTYDSLEDRPIEKKGKNSFPEELKRQALAKYEAARKRDLTTKKFQQAKARAARQHHN